MGNQGMTNWKLTALFAISLMLIVGTAQLHRDRKRRFRNSICNLVRNFWSNGASTALTAKFRGSNQLYRFNIANLGDMRRIRVPDPACRR